MNMSKKIVYGFVLLLSFCLFNKDVNAMIEITSWDPVTEELVYEYEASFSGIRKIWLDCKSPTGKTTITLYVHNNGNGFTTKPVKGRKDTSNLVNGSYSCEAHVATEGDSDDRANDGDIVFTKKNSTVTPGSSQLENNNACSSIIIQEDCENDMTCVWANGKCNSANVAERPCDEPAIRRVLRIFGYILLVAKIVVPLLIIGFGTFDVFKSVIDKDEKSFTKQLKQLGIRVIAGFVVFFVPNIVNVAFSLSDKLNIMDTDQYQTCASCLLDPTNDQLCSIEETPVEDN